MAGVAEEKTEHLGAYRMEEPQESIFSLPIVPLQVGALGPGSSIS